MSQPPIGLAVEGNQDGGIWSGWVDVIRMDGYVIRMDGYVIRMDGND